jgi:murein DD-endopeptidase MepM/ murein hydrolase activator NlpD
MLPTDKSPSQDIGSKPLLGSSRKMRIVSAVAIFFALCAFGAAGVAPMAPDAADLPVKSITQELAIPDLAEQIAHLQSDEQQYFREERVRPGDTLAALLSRLGVNDDAATAFIKSDRTAYAILQLKPGKRIQATTGKDGQLLRLTAALNDNTTGPVKIIVVTRDGNRFIANETSAPVERRIEMRSGDIRSSLFAATDAAQVPDTVASQIVEMFATNIDFASDLRRGDRFNVVYESFWQNGEFIRAGRVLAGEFINGSNRYQAVWFDEPGNKQGGGYYSFDGKSLKKAFLRSPIEFTRISSGFSMRTHPISGQWKQHQGVDFAAGIGTPIRAAGDGVIDFVGTQNGYGNVIYIKHWNNYSTVYAHMSRFAHGLRKGMKINQGEVIGYVGATGWATGPHLHYEFRINNQPRDPMSVNVPNTQALAGADLQRFRAIASEMSHRFALLNPAQNNIKLAFK